MTFCLGEGGIFHYAVSILDYIASDDTLSDEWLVGWDFKGRDDR
jgi:hypothetical protein